MQARDARHFCTLSIVCYANNLVVAHRFQWILTQAAHDLSHLSGALSAWIGSIDNAIEVVAIALIQGIHRLVEVHVASGIPRSHFNAKHGGDNSVLIASMCANKIAVGLLKAHEEAILLTGILELVNLVADVLEAREHAAHLKAASTCQDVGHSRGYDGGNGYLILGFLATLFSHGKEPVHKQDAHLVTGKQHVIAVMRDCSTHTVGIWVGCHQKIWLDLVGKLEAQLKCLTELWIWIGACGEVSVWLCLLWNNVNVIDANLLEDACDALHTCTIKRRVYNLVAVGSLKSWNRNALDSLDEVVQNLFWSPNNQALLQALFKVHRLDVKRIDACDVCRNLCCSLVSNLTTVIVVYLIAVIRRRVVACGKHDTCGSLEVADGKRERWDRLNTWVDIYTDAISCQNTSCNLLEILTLKARIPCKSHGRILIVSIEVIRKTLGCLSNNVDVHAVGANANGAAKTSSTKSK